MTRFVELGIARRLWGAMRYDIRLGLRQAMTPLLYVVLLLVWQLFGIYGDATTLGIAVGDMTYGDTLFALFAGKSVPEWRPGLIPMPPLGWTFLLMLCLWSTLAHADADLHAMGYQSLLRSGGRFRWWLSKTLATLVLAGVLCLAVCGVAGIISCAWGQEVSLEVTAAGFSVGGVSWSDGEVLSGDMMLPWASAVAALVALMIIQCSLSMLFRPVLAFAASSAHLVAVYYVQTPLLFANGLMLMRSDFVPGAGLPSLSVLGCAIGLAIIVNVLCYRAFARRDFLSDEE